MVREHLPLGHRIAEKIAPHGDIQPHGSRRAIDDLSITDDGLRTEGAGLGGQNLARLPAFELNNVRFNQFDRIAHEAQLGDVSFFDRLARESHRYKPDRVPGPSQLTRHPPDANTRRAQPISALGRDRAKAGGQNPGRTSGG